MGDFYLSKQTNTYHCAKPAPRPDQNSVLPFLLIRKFHQPNKDAKGTPATKLQPAEPKVAIISIAPI